jgi:exodeoxyribonuclease VII small subunit
MPKKKTSYSSQIQELEEILRDMNNGDISVDDLQKKVLRAKELINSCKEQLKTTQDEINSILGES